MMNCTEYNSQAAQLAQELVKLCSENAIKVATAESCTGGMISAAITAVSGSSSVIELGVCSYSNRIKNEVLGVSASTLEKYSEYSVQCAAEMAQGVKKLASADYGVSTTGVAGPTGGSEEHPVGEVCIAVSGRTDTAERFVFPQESSDGASGRDTIRAAATAIALGMLLRMIKDELPTER